MYAKRKTGAVYGKRRFNKTADQLWDDCMAASPVKPKTAVQEVIVHLDPATESSLSLDTTALSVELSSFEVARPLQPISQNAATTKAPVGKSLACDDSLFEPLEGDYEEARPASASVVLDLPEPLTTSTPAAKPNTHFRFESDESNGDSSLTSQSDSSADSSSDLGELTQALAQTGLEEVETESSQLLALCNQSEPQDFEAYVATLLATHSVDKLGEASFSEVFLATSNDGEAKVLKIIPFGDGPNEVPLNDIKQELRITKTMTSCPGFVKMKNAVIVQGCYPQALLDIWDGWHEAHGSESDRPDWYLASQRYCILALEHGGTDIEHAVFTSWRALLACFLQVVQALSLGEARHGFEHRDLHWGNVLVRDPTCTDTHIDNITIIDYTLSRAECSDGIACYQFGDRAIFEAEGNDYQFEIYRFMLDLVEEDEAGVEHWERRMPRTNVLWLHYLADKLLSAKGLKRPAARKPHTEERQAWQKLENLRTVMNPKRRYRGSDLPLTSAADVLSLL